MPPTIKGAAPFTLKNERGETVCGAWRSKERAYCQQTIIDPVNGRCRKHGGTKERGILNPNFRTGRYSSALADSTLIGAYLAAKADPELLSLRDEIALVDAQMQAQFLLVDAQDNSLELLNELRDLNRSLADAIRKSDAKRVALMLTQIEAQSLIPVNGAAEFGRLNELIELRRKLVESERKYTVEQEQYWTLDRASATFGAILQILRERISDRKVLSEIGKDIRGLLSGGNDGSDQ